MRIGTRASNLARTQSQLIADRITELTGEPAELVTVTTEGDRNRAPLTSFGGAGVFVAAVREELAAGAFDVAVHSLKDLPTAADPRFALAAVPRRLDPRDVVVARDGLTLGELPAGSTVGTGSPRRAAQLNALGLGLRIEDLRGNVETRMGKVADGSLDAVLLARAGLLRIDRADMATEVLDPLQMLPAPGQGALALECRADDEATRSVLAWLDDADTRAAVSAERAVLARLEAGCSAPVGALAEVAWGEDGEDEIYLRAVVAHVSGEPNYRASATGPVAEAERLGIGLADEMLAEGVAAWMAVPA